MSDLTDILGGVAPGSTVIEPTMADAKRVINNHSVVLQSLTQTVATLIQLLKEKETVEVRHSPWWKFWARKLVPRVGVFTTTEFDALLERLKVEAEEARYQEVLARQLSEAARITDQILYAGPKSPLYTGEGASIETRPDGSMRLVPKGG